MSKLTDEQKSSIFWLIIIALWPLWVLLFQIF